MTGVRRSLDIVVVGAGIVGLFLAIALAGAGFRVTVFERRADPRRSSRPPARPSLNLAFSARGLGELERHALSRVVLDRSATAYGRLVHTDSGSVTHHLYGPARESLHFVLRKDILDGLLLHAGRTGDIRVDFEREVVDVDPETGDVLLSRPGGRRTWRMSARLVIGADGASSVARRALLRTGHVGYSQSYLEQGYVEMTIPAGCDPAPSLRSDVLHVWPRGRRLLLGFPNHDGSFTLSLHMPFDGPYSFASLRSEHDLRQLLERDFAEFAPLSTGLATEFLAQRPNAMVTIRCQRWTYGGRLALAGDAAHAIVPHYGQGATAGLEDARILVARSTSCRGARRRPSSGTCCSGSWRRTGG
jgi:kynurenine 3-monooxygenase